MVLNRQFLRSVSAAVLIAAGFFLAFSIKLGLFPFHFWLPTVYTAAEFSKRARSENAFVTRVLEQPKIWVIGSEDDLTVAA